MLRISTTWLESYRRVLKTEWAKEEELIATIKGKPFEPTFAMQLGSAWQKVLELNAGRESNCYTLMEKQFAFTSPDIKRGLGIIPRGAIPKMKTTRHMTFSGSVVELVGVANAVHGLEIHENKARLNAGHASDYEPSLQWRAYLWLFHARSVQYNIFQFGLPEEGCPELRDVQTFRFNYYEDLEADIRRWVSEFVAWLGERGLTKYAERKS